MLAKSHRIEIKHGEARYDAEFVQSMLSTTCARFPRMRRSRWRVGWWLFPARLFTRALALAHVLEVFFSSGMSALAAG